MSLAASHMDGIYRRQRHIYDASRKFYLLGRDELIREMQPPAGGRVLEIGCGTARNLIVAARAFPSARLFGFDVSEQMLTTARASIAREGLFDQVRVTRGDATNFDPGAAFGVETFDRVFISYALSMIPPWRAALSHALDMLAPNGSLHVVDFFDFGDLPVWFGAGMNKWLGAFSVTPRLDFETELSSISSARGMRARVVKRYRGYAVHGVVVAPGPMRGVSSNDRGARLREPETVDIATGYGDAIGGLAG